MGFLGGWGTFLAGEGQEMVDSRRWVEVRGGSIAYLKVLGGVNEAGMALVRVLGGRGRRILLVLARRRCVVLLECGQFCPFHPSSACLDSTSCLRLPSQHHKCHPSEATKHKKRLPRETYLTNIPPNPNPPVINPVSIRRRHPRRRHHPHPRHTLQPLWHAQQRRQHIRRHERRVHPNTAVQCVHVEGRAVVRGRHDSSPRRLVLRGLVDKGVALAQRVQHHGVLLVGRLRVLLALAVGEVLREEGLLGGGVVVGAADVGVADGRVAEPVPLHYRWVAGCEVVVEGLLSVESLVVARGLGGGVGGGGCGETARGGDRGGIGLTGGGNTKVSVVRGGKGTRARVDARGGADFSAERRPAETEISKGGGGLSPRKSGREGTRRGGKGGAGGAHLVSGWGAGLGWQWALEDSKPER